MRDPNRIPEFCNEIAEIWQRNVPDWRFGQLWYNVFKGADPFYMEEEIVLKRIKEFFGEE